ncbi:MAG: hypothetical protein WBX00_32640 [Isosphaeraceae bacterium]
MRRMILVGLACGALLAAQPCMAGGLTLSVVEDPSSTADLSKLTAGQSITFDVNLAGLDVTNGQTLGSLGGTVSFDGTLLGQPLSISPGAVVPDPSGFLTAVNPGLADASYYFGFSNSNSLITSNGTFYSFTVVVQPSVTGSGILSLDFVAASDANSNPINDIASGTDLPFSVGAAAVPEPDTLVMTVIALAIILARVGFARLRSRQA